MKRVGASALGVVIGLALLEAMLRPLASVQLPPPPDIAHDVLAGPLITSRQIEEGVQVSHFTAGGSRWTGTTPDSGTPLTVIIGDSYIVAREVADDETMGAWVERLSRVADRAVNTRQYGWRAARPAQYVLVARDVVARWDPAKVVVVLGGNDFDDRALTDTMETPITRNGVLDRSSLVMLARHRMVLLDARAQRSLARWKRRLRVQRASPTGSVPTVQAAAVDDAENVTEVPARTTEIEGRVVEALAQAYGKSRLAIVYVANTRVPDGAEENERHLLAACTSQQVRCVSTRDAMRALERDGVITRGFSTTTLGSGHLNPDGHEMMGRLIWSLIR